MQELQCGTARRWMQATHELPLLAARQLDRHLLSCTRCAAHWQDQLEVNLLIHASLDAAVGTQSVREATRTKLLASGARRRRRWRLRVPHIPRPAWLALPLAAVLAVVAVIASDLNPKLGGAPALIGAPWHVIRPEIAFPMAVDPIHSNHLLAGAFGQVYESWTAGESWRPLAQLPAGLSIRSVAIDESNSRRFVVAVRNSVYVSDDSGRRWTRTASRLPGAMNMFVLQSPHAANTWYLGPSVLWKSTDGGRTWFRDGAGAVFAPDGIQALTFAPDGDLYTGIWAGGVAVSHNGGLTWQRRASGLAKQVLDVSASGNTVWAATTKGIYSSSDLGLHWQRRGPHAHFSATSIVDGGNYQVAGGKGGIFRSDDSGAHWRASSNGLPFYSYVYNLVPDPRNPHRVYACLNTDGIFRSDDDGRTWMPASSGLPLTGSHHAARSVLFRSGGVLWITGASGIDPHNLTVDNEVTTAVTSPDGVAVAYVTGAASGWAVRIVNAGGSATKTVAQGTGAPPTSLFWAPSSSALIVPTSNTVYSMDMRTGEREWTVPPGEHLLGWSANGKQLLWWSEADAKVVIRDPRTGTRSGSMGAFRVAPSVAPDAHHIAQLARGTLEIGIWDHPIQSRAPLVASCSLGPWSDDSTRFITVCGGEVQERALDGRVLAQARLPRTAFWAPGSHTQLLFFRHGLRRWAPHRASRLILSAAQSVQQLPSSQK